MYKSDCVHVQECLCSCTRVTEFMYKSDCVHESSYKKKKGAIDVHQTPRRFGLQLSAQPALTPWKIAVLLSVGVNVPALCPPMTGSSVSTP